MATQLTFTDNSFVGLAADYFIVKAVSENKTVMDGHIYVQSGINEKLYMPRLRTSGNLLQAGWSGGIPSTQGGFDVTERVLDPQEIELYTEYNPNQFRAFWSEFAPSPGQPIVDTELLQFVRLQMVEEILKQTSFDVAKAIWQGDKGTSPTPSYPNNLFVGLISRALADSGVIDVSGATTLTSSNIGTELDKLYQVIPDAIVDHPDLKIFVSITTGKLYQEYLTNISGKGETEGTQRRLDQLLFRGIPVVPLAEMKDNVMFCTYSSNSRQSNLHLGVTAEANHTIVQSARVQANSELHFFKMMFKADTQIANGDEVVLYGS